jgi:hypothetical protein
MKTLILSLALAAVTFLTSESFATQADDTTITITGQTAGPTPFISQLSLTASDTSGFKSIQFTVASKAGSMIRPLSGTYSIDYMISRGYLVPPSLDIFLPVYGLYADFTNTVTLTYNFLDGSSKTDSTDITTTAFDDQGCGYNSPTVLQARSTDTSLSFDYIFVESGCGDYSPVILDTDGNLRWVSPFGLPNALTASSTLFDNAVYAGKDAVLYRIELDGTVTTLADYSSMGVVAFHHDMDRGKFGLIIEVDTTTQYESVLFEIDTAGNIIKEWHLADIITAAMIAGGDDPSQFVYPSPTDWFHNNSAAYDRGSDSLIVSSRENFVIALDYETGDIKWILGDTTKKWFQFPSLAQFALDLGPDTLPPIGQHGLSIAHNQDLLLFDNGFFSSFQQPPGINRTYASPRRYRIDTEANTATENWNFEMDQSILDPICSSIYEDAALNYLIDYAFVGGFTSPDPQGQLLALDASGNIVFYYSYSTLFCDTVYNSRPIHLENTAFPAVGPQALNLSTRGLIGSGDNALIGGLIVLGPSGGTKTVVLRALGPSLGASGVPGTLADPTLTLFDDSGSVVASNDDWQSDASSEQIAAEGLAPSDPAEAALMAELAPGAYTAVVSSKDFTSGLGLVEAYDVGGTGALANISTRGSIGTGDNVLISGFIIGDVSSATVVIRAVGPSLAAAGVSDPLSDPTFSVFDNNGVLVGENDNWQDDPYANEITQNGFALTDDAEAATILNLSAGAYTAVVSGVNGGTGTGLVETYNLQPVGQGIILPPIRPNTR